MMVLPTLPKAVEYAIKVLTYLAVSAGRPVSASEAARCVRIPPSQAAKTLHFLSWAGFTRSRRGPKGGYLLGKRPEEIRLEQIMKLYQPAAEQGVEGSVDPILQVWSETSRSGEQAWERFTIAELARRTAGQWQCSKCTEEAASLRKTKKSKEKFPGAHG